MDQELFFFKFLTNGLAVVETEKFSRLLSLAEVVDYDLLISL
jgi:hypothetical protein